jgi:hypothetical protein
MSQITGSHRRVAGGKMRRSGGHGLNFKAYNIALLERDYPSCWARLNRAKTPPG